MSEWQRGKLREIAKITMGQSPIGERCNTFEVGIPLLNGPTEFGEFFPTPKQWTTDSKKQCQKDDLLFCVRGSTTGKMNWANQEYSIGRGLASIQHKNGFEYRHFIKGVIDYELQNILSSATGSTFPNVSRELLGNLEIPLPPLDEQKRIAQILSSLDNKIENNNAINKNLEEQAQAIFKSWFVDFEPFGGTMPSDWREGTLGEVATVTSGKRPQSKEKEATETAGIPIVGASSVMGFTSKVLYNEKILVIGRVGTHGIVQRWNSPCWASDNTLVLMSKFYEFVYHNLLGIDYINLNRGSTQPLITQTDIKNTLIILPPNEVLNDFEGRVGLLMKYRENLLNENQKLSQLRDTLLPKLMSGELRV